MKISFLMAAHNEEKIIAEALDNLCNLPYDDYEVIIGLDGCTDRTERIIQNYPVKYCNLNLRQGKTAVINKIVHLAQGEIIIIHDADWIFKVKDRKAMDKLVSIFDNKLVGGIAESYPIQYPLRKKAGILERGVMIHNKMWMDYVKKTNGVLFLPFICPHPLLVNILRRELYRPNKTLADDFERFKFIKDSGHFVYCSNNLDFPRMVTAGEVYTFKGLIKQKERTALARKQVKLKSFGWRFPFYVLEKMLMMSLKDIFAFTLVNIAFVIGTIKSKFNEVSTTEEGWKMRGR